MVRLISDRTLMGATGWLVVLVTAATLVASACDDGEGEDDGGSDSSLAPTATTTTSAAPGAALTEVGSGSAHYGYQFDIEAVVSYDYSSGEPIEAYPDGIEGARANIRSFLGWAEENGVTLLATEVFGREGVMFFDSPTLADAGFTLAEDVDFLELVASEIGAHGGFTGLSISLEDIGHIALGTKEYDDSIDAEALTPEALRAVMAELAAYGERHGVPIWVNEEALDDAYIQAAAEQARQLGVVYAHYFTEPGGRPDILVTEDYAMYPADAANDPADQDYIRFLLETGATPGRIGLNSLVLGQAQALGKAGGVGTAGGWGMVAGSQVNAMLFRAVQFMPSYYLAISASGDVDTEEMVRDQAFLREFSYSADILPHLDRARRRDGDAERPVANLIWVGPSEGLTGDGFHFDLAEQVRVSDIEWITNAISAAGYDLYFTHDRPHGGAADAYFVIAPGVVGDWNAEGARYVDPLPAEVAALFDQDGAPVFLQAMGGLPDPSHPSWASVVEQLGLEGEWDVRFSVEGGTNPVPEAVEYQGQRLTFRGYEFYPDEPNRAGRTDLYHAATALTGEHLSGATALLTGRSDLDGDGEATEEMVLATAHDGRYFLNGNMHHLALSAWLAEVLRGAPTWNAPSLAYASVAPERAAFWAAEDAALDVNLDPAMDDAAVLQFDARGRPVEPTVTFGAGEAAPRLTGNLPRYHLAIAIQE